MSFLDYDYDDLARQLQHGLERLGVNFLRSHGARMRRDLVDFHGYEQVDLELTHDGHTLKVHQVGRPRGFENTPAPAGALEEQFESTFDGWPTTNYPRQDLARWLAALPAGEAPPERTRGAADPSNPFARERRPTPPRLEPDPEPSSNPFLSERSAPAGPNPFAQSDRDRKRRDSLRWLKGDDD